MDGSAGFTINEITLRTRRGGVRSLSWHGDTLVDWVQGRETYCLDGTIVAGSWMPGYDRLDAATVSPSGRYAIIHENLGTKGIILGTDRSCDSTTDQGAAGYCGKPSIIREINRSFENADSYEYPIAAFRLRDRREVIAHCPDEYNRLVIEDTVSRDRLTGSTTQEPFDYYYSRLAASPGGKRLLSAGWEWHPCNALALYDVEAVIADPELLDREDAILRTPSEMSSAAFVDDSLIVISSASDPVYHDDDSWLPTCAVALYDLAVGGCIATVRLDEPVGTVMPISSRLIISLYDHPKLIDMEEGRIVHRWPDIPSGKQESSIIHHLSIPPMALDGPGGRIAIAMPGCIRVIEIAVC